MFVFGQYVDSYTIRRVLLVVGGVFLLAAGGLFLITGKDPVGTATGADDKQPDCRAFAVDVGTSTARDGDASLRGRYLAFMHRELQAAAKDRAQLYVGYFAGQPPQDFVPYRFDDGSSNGFDANVARAQTIAEAQAAMTAELTNPSTLTDGSAVIATVNAMANETPAGCDMTVISDGIENSSLGTFGIGGRTRMLGPGAVDALLARVQDKGLVPELVGRRFAMPYLIKTAGQGPRSELGVDRRRAATRQFWVDFAKAAGTALEVPSE